MSAIRDFGIWAQDERAALIWLAQAAGARASELYLPIDEPAQIARIRARVLHAPHTTFEISVADLAGWRALFQAPTEDEVAGRLHPPAPTEYAT